MSQLSLHDVAMRTYTPMLGGLRHVLAKGAEYGSVKGIGERELVDARLAPDMFPLSRQVQVATDHVKGSMFRLAARDVPKVADDERSIAELQARIDSTLELVRTIPAAAFEGAADRTVTLKVGERELSFPGADYLIGFAIPNFYFHLTTAYAILRHLGVPLGKRDFFGAPGV